LKRIFFKYRADIFSKKRFLAGYGWKNCDNRCMFQMGIVIYTGWWRIVPEKGGAGEAGAAGYG
jgi:hypothetical protein